MQRIWLGLALVGCRQGAVVDSTLAATDEPDTTTSDTTSSAPTEGVGGTATVHIDTFRGGQLFMAVADASGAFAYARTLPYDDVQQVVVEDVPEGGFVSAILLHDTLGVHIQTVGGVQDGDELWLWSAGRGGSSSVEDGTLTVEIPEPAPTASVDVTHGCSGAWRRSVPSLVEHWFPVRCLGSDGSVNVVAWSEPDDGSVPAIAYQADVPVVGTQVPFTAVATLDRWNTSPGLVRTSFELGPDTDDYRVHIGAFRAELPLGDDVDSSWVNGEDAEASLATDGSFHDKVVLTGKGWDFDPKVDAFGRAVERSLVVDSPADGAVFEEVFAPDHHGVAWSEFSFDPATGRAQAAGASDTCAGEPYDMVSLRLEAWGTKTRLPITWDVVGPADMKLQLLDLLERFDVEAPDPTKEDVFFDLSAHAFAGATYDDVRTHRLLFDQAYYDPFAAMDVHQGVCSIQAFVR